MNDNNLNLELILEQSCIKHLLPKYQLFDLINISKLDNINIELPKRDFSNTNNFEECDMEKLKTELSSYNSKNLKFHHFDTVEDIIFDKTKLGLSELAEYLLPDELISKDKFQHIKQDSIKRKREDEGSFEVKKVIIKSQGNINIKSSYYFDYNLLDNTAEDGTKIIHNELMNIMNSIDGVHSTTIKHLSFFVDVLLKRDIHDENINEALSKILALIKEDCYDTSMASTVILIIKILMIITDRLLNFEYLDNIFVFISEYSQDIASEETHENVLQFADILRNLELLLTPKLIIDSWDLNRIVLSLQHILNYGNNNYDLNSPKVNKAIDKLKASTTQILKMVFGKYPLQRDLILDLIMNSFVNTPTSKDDSKLVKVNNTSITYFTYNIIQMLSTLANGVNVDECLQGLLEQSKLHEVEMVSYSVILTDMITEKVMDNVRLKSKLIVYSKDLVNSMENIDEIIPDFLLSSLINKLINIMDNGAMSNISLLVLAELGNFIIKGKDKLTRDETFENLLRDNLKPLKKELRMFKTNGDKNYILKKYNFINEIKEYISRSEYKDFNKQVFNEFEDLINDEFKNDLKTGHNGDNLSISQLNSLNYYQVYIKLLLDSINNQRLQLTAIKNFSILINNNKGLINSPFIKDLITKVLKEDKIIVKEVILNFLKGNVKYIELFLNEIEGNVLNDSLNIRKIVFSINKIVFEHFNNPLLRYYGLKGIFKIMDDENTIIQSDVRAYLLENVFEVFMNDIDVETLDYLIRLFNEDSLMISRLDVIMTRRDVIKMLKNINHYLTYKIVEYTQDNETMKLSASLSFMNNLLQYHQNIFEKQDLVVLIPLLNLNNTDLMLRFNILKIFSKNLKVFQKDVNVKNELNLMFLNDMLKYQLNEIEHLVMIVVGINNRDALIKLYESLLVTLNNCDNDNKLKKLTVSIISFIIHSEMVKNMNTVVEKLVTVFHTKTNLILKSIVINQLMKLCNKEPMIFANERILSLLNNTLHLNNEYNILKREIVIGLTNYMQIQETSNDDITLNLIVKYSPKILIMVVQNNEFMNTIIYKYIKNLVYFKIINPMIYLPFILPLVIHKDYNIKALDLEFNDINILNKGTNLMMKSFTSNNDIKNLDYYSFIENLLSLDVDVNFILKIFIKLLRTHYTKKLETLFLTLNLLKIVHKFNKTVIHELMNITNILLDNLEQQENEEPSSSYRILRIFLRNLNIQSNNLNFINFEIKNYDFEGLK
ncbi:uncharacterized protein HGUI_03557 [Hanseniaspora guilliermondii]|uniref:Sister chromatid cohesion protein n=1 Tax=Hanseniaspora guilliermondii TaxID=56406 RepID=A0A1L0B6A7_9ASCO|nr:uncharacterized protein HGUI_03557 [Hanseniaspora guilliermondii]